MASIEVRGVFKTHAKQQVLKGVDLHCPEGEFLVLVGPSGCGKSTLLNAIAGLDQPDLGEIKIGGEDVTEKAPKDRDIAMVFQSYALYPTMTARQNISFGLEMRGVPKAERERRIAEAARFLRIETLLDRKPSELSGGQRQRVAMGRAIVRDPAVFLFDEPLSNLDANLRLEMRVEIKKLHRRMKTTIVYVTHDQIEAMTLGTIIVVMKDGVVLQAADPQTIYNSPANIFVAGFIGAPSMNFIPARLEAAGDSVVARVEGDGDVVFSLDRQLSDLRDWLSREIVLGVRSEDISDVGVGAADEAASFERPVELTESTGADLMAVVVLGGKEITARLGSASATRAGVKTRFSVRRRKVHLFDASTGNRL